MSLAALPVEHPDLTVVKLGGSVIRSPRLGAWLEAIAEAGAPTVVVPGGGALADEVRVSQTNLGFDDRAAHRMALLAMDQLAWAVAGMDRRYDVATTAEDIRRLLGAGRIPLWAPYAMAAENAGVPASWAVTSDSLALWLTAKLGADRCYMVKSVEAPRRRASAAELAREGVLDEAFPSFLAAVDAQVFLLGRGDETKFAAAARSGHPLGARIDA